MNILSKLKENKNTMFMYWPPELQEKARSIGRRHFFYQVGYRDGKYEWEPCDMLVNSSPELFCPSNVYRLTPFYEEGLKLEQVVQELKNNVYTTFSEWPKLFQRAAEIIGKKNFLFKVGNEFRKFHYEPPAWSPFCEGQVYKLRDDYVTNPRIGPIKIYLSHPITADSKDNKLKNCKRACKFADQVTLGTSHDVEVYVPGASTETFVEKALALNVLTVDQVLQVDCGIIDDCDMVIFLTPEGILSPGMKVEFKHAVDKPFLVCHEYNDQVKKNIDLICDEIPNLS